MNVSALIKELETRKDDYILVADVINVLGNATNSKPHEVVKYLDAHNIEEYITLLYMDESYTFEPYNGHILGLGNDANITYFLKADVMAFDPIAKHGIFKSGSNDLINPYQKNLDDEYLTMDEVVANLNNRAGLSCDYEKIRDLARKRKITPCFYFNGYVCELSPDQYGELSPCFFETPHTEIMTGYFTYRLLVEQISSYDEYITLPHCEMGNEILIYRLLERQGDTQISYGDALALFASRPQPFDDRKNYSNRFGSIGFDEIRFSKQELDSYIASLAPVFSNNSYGKSLQDSELLAKLESAQAENNALNARVSTAINTYRQNQSEIKELKAQLEKANADNLALNEQLSKINAELIAAKTAITAQPFDWQNMSEHIYPPELHLAMMIWQRIYGDNELKDSHITSHNGKFEVIAKKMKLNPQSTLGKRIRMVINTAHIKKKQTELAEQLQAVKQLNMPANQ